MTLKKKVKEIFNKELPHNTTFWYGYASLEHAVADWLEHSRNKTLHYNVDDSGAYKVFQQVARNTYLIDSKGSKLKVKLKTKEVLLEGESPSGGVYKIVKISTYITVLGSAKQVIEAEYIKPFVDAGQHEQGRLQEIVSSYEQR